jgi:hypothetical protein
MIDENEEAAKQHNHAHALSEAIQRTIEEYQNEHDVVPSTILLGSTMVQAAWSDFCAHLGLSMLGTLELTTQAVGCSAELREYLRISAPRFTAYLRQMQDEDPEVNTNQWGDA